MPLFEACLTKPYRWLAVFHSWLVCVGKSARVDCIKLVALLLAPPVFEVRYLLFKLLYALQERRLRLAGFYEFEPGVQNGVKQLRGFFPNFGRGLKRLHALRDISGRLEALNSRRDCSYINHRLPPLSRLTQHGKQP